MKIEEVTYLEYKAHFINKIPELYPIFRQDSKACTFALQYQGTAHTLVANSGFSKAEANTIVNNYHTAYTVSAQWAQDKLTEASKTGYVVGAFGIRIRTPILLQTIINKASTPYEAQAESRTAGNALSQSYGLLNNRAAIEFQKRVLASEFAHAIKPIAHIHDAMYFVVRDEIKTVKWFNDNLPDCMAWQKLPELQHNAVKLSGGVDLFYPNWSEATFLPNNSTEQQILDICRGKAK